MLALPYRHGGLGIRNPVLSADTEFRKSRELTAELTDLICQQDMDLSRLDEEKVKETKRTIRSEKEAAFTEEVQLISTAIDEKAKSCLSVHARKGRLHGYQLFQ